MKWGRVNTPVTDVCNGGQIRVAYNNLPGVFSVNMKDNKMVQYQYQYQYDGSLLMNHMTFPHEILTSFIIEHELSLNFLYNNQNWTGTVGMVSGHFFTCYIG